MSIRSARPLLAVSSSWQCTFCLSRRSLTTTTQLQSIGPESPRYIEIPQSRQPNKPERPRVKGILPVPRRIFGHGQAKPIGLLKADDAALADKTKLPKHPRQNTGRQTDVQAYKTRMADMRRENLREGLSSLRERQLAIDQRTRERVQRRHAERQALVDAPEREDERLTSPSVDPAITAYLNSKILPDPDREQRVEEKRRRTAAMEANRRETRMMAMQTLYMNARDFVVDREGLDQALEKAFGTDEHPVGFGSFDDEESVWAYGPQLGTAGMLRRSQPSEAAGNITDVVNAENTKQRLRTMAEELTGGTLDDPPKARA